MMLSSLSQAGVSALRASHFLLLRQKKVSKEKATPGSAPGVARSLALLGRPGGSLNSPAAQTPRTDCPRPACVAQRLSRGPVNHPFSEPVSCALSEGVEIKYLPVEPRRLSGPHVERRATEKVAEKARGLSEVRSPEFRSARHLRVAQGSRQRRPRSLGSPFLWLLSFGEAKESTPARKAESQAHSENKSRGKLRNP